MAATRLIAMHVNKGKTIRKSLSDRTSYAMNEEKTDGGEWISSYACDVKTVDEEFLLSKSEYLRITGRQITGDIIAYQIRQSFKPGEISPEEANRVGYETAMRFTKGNHAFIVATHTDKNHIHNHVVFNSTNLTCDRKFRDSWFIALALQRLSDQVCLEHGLSVIKPRKNKRQDKCVVYPERETLRDKIREDIEEVFLQNPKDMEEMLLLLKRKEYEIKKGKHLAIRGKGQKRFVRLRSLGEGYTREDLENRISGKAEKPVQEKTKPPRAKVKREFDLLIDIQEKMKQGKEGGYTRWATVYNIKQMAQTLLFLQEKDVRDYELLEHKTNEVTSRFHELSEKIKEAEKRLSEIAVLKTHIYNYAKTREVYVAYREAGYSKKFLEEHREEITLHKVAKAAFSDLPMERIPKVKELNEEYAEVLAKKKELYAEYRQVKKEMQDYVTAKHNIDAFLKNCENEKQLQEVKRQKEKTDER